MNLTLRTILAATVLVVFAPGALRAQQAAAPSPQPAPAAQPSAAAAQPAPSPTIPSAAPSTPNQTASAAPQRPAASFEAHAPILVSHIALAFDSMAADPEMQRIMGANQSQGRFAVLNTDGGFTSMFRTGPIASVAVDADDGKVFVAGGGLGVLALDRKSLVRIDTINLDGHVGALAFDPDNHRLFVDRAGSPWLWMIDARTHEVVGSARLDGNPRGVVYDTVAKRVFATVGSLDRLEEIDPDAGVVTASWQTGAVGAPTGVATDSADGIVLIAGWGGVLASIDMRTGAILGTAQVAPGINQIAFDPVTRNLFCASGAKALVAIVRVGAAGALTTIGNIPTKPGAQSIALVRSGGRLDVWIGYPGDHGSYMQCFSMN
jgi:hypothetical protein